MLYINAQIKVTYIFPYYFRRSASMSQHLYRQLEQLFREEIKTGQRSPGERLPSVRNLCSERGVSKSTVLTAYSRLEAEGLIDARPRSGYFVSTRILNQSKTFKTPAPSQPIAIPATVSAGQVLLDIMEQGAAFDLLPSKMATTSTGNVQLRRCLARAQRRQSNVEQLYYDDPMGLSELRVQLAQRLAHGGSCVDESEVLVTAGCQHALLLALMATTEPGDVVAVESPGFYGVFQLLETLGLQALEIPSSVENGISPDALEMALQHWDVKALMLSPCYATPTGACMPDAHKQRILALTCVKGIAVIEDDIYGEIYFGIQRPRSLYSYDNTGSVILCSSFSKCLSRDLRIGWIAPGRYLERIKQLKLVTSLASSRTLQQGISQFLEEGGLERHLREKRLQYRRQCQQLQELISKYLPMTVSCSQPQGGLAIWVELPDFVNTLPLYARARESGIVLTPGRLFTAQDRYHNFLRMSFVHPWTSPRVDALKRLGQLIQEK